MPGPWDEYARPSSGVQAFGAPDPTKGLDATNKQLDADKKRIDIAKAKQDLSDAQANGGDVLDAPAINFYAQQVLAGSPMPSLGMGKQAAAARQQIMKEVARQAGASGLTGADLARQIAHYKAGSASLANLEKQVGTISAAEQTALANGQQFLDRSQELPGQTNIAPLNAVSNFVQRHAGGTTISAMDAAYNTFVNEYAKVVGGSPSGAGTLSDSARHEAMDTIRGNASVAQKQAAFAQMKTDMANRMTALHRGISDAYTSLTQKPGYAVPDSTTALHTEDRSPIPGIGAGGGGAEGGQSGGHGNGPGPTIATGGQFITPDDKRVAKIFNSAYQSGASFETLNQMSLGAGRGPLGEDHKKWIAARDKGQPVPDFPPGQSGNVGDAMATLGKFASSPVGGFTGAMLNSGGFGLPQLAAGDAPFNAMREASPKASFTGDILGGLTGTAAGAKALISAGVSLPRAATAANLGFGAIYGASTDENNRLRGAGVGTAASLLGDAAGKYAIAPLATRVMDAAPVQNVVNKARGMFGQGAVAVPRPLDIAENAIGNEATPRIGDIFDKLTEAARLNLPFSLADADPALRQSLGSATRLAPDVRATIGKQLADRSLGQADRALAGIDHSLVPPVSMSGTSKAIRDSARAAADPLYAQARAMPAPDNPVLNDILNTPEGSKAAQNAYNIALTRGKSPAEIAIDAEGRLQANPTYDTHDLIKKGFDQSLRRKELLDPITGKLDLEGNPMAQAINDMRGRYVSALDANNPIYKQARATYAEKIRPRTALGAGYDAAAPNVTQDQFGQMAAGLSGAEHDAFKAGFSTNLADRVNKTRLSANPYDIVAGTPDQQAKLGVLYPGAPDFFSKRALEQDMAATAHEVNGGSPTQGRALADQRFTGTGFGAGDAAEVGFGLATGTPPINVGYKVAKAAGAGMFGRRAAERAAERARQTAPMLYNPDPTASAAGLQQLLDDIAARRGYEDFVKRRSGLILGGAAAGATGGG